MQFAAPFVPSVIGAPFSWATFETRAEFTFRTPDGQEIGKHRTMDEHPHVLGFYYGFQNLRSPIRRDLAAALDSLNGYILQEQDRLRAGVKEEE